MSDALATGPVRTAVVITATEPEPRSFGKQVVLGGLLDHLCSRLGADAVHLVIIGRDDVERPATAYTKHLVRKPSAREQLTSVVGRVPFGPRSSLQEAALYAPRVRDELASVLRGIGADLEVWDTMRTGQYAKELPRGRRVLYADDLFSKRYASMLDEIAKNPGQAENPLGEFGKLLPGPVGSIASRPAVFTPLLRVERRLTERSERSATSHFDATLLVNAEEADELRAATGDDSVRTLLPLLKDRPATARSYSGTPTFVFLGGLDYAPNRHGLTWFLEQCRTQVLAAVPDFELLVVGRGSDSLPAAAADWDGHVRGLGWVDDLDGVLGSAAAMISPLHMGSGTKIKVLEALSRGLPVVATPHGVLGLAVGADDGCLVASEPDALVARLVEAIDPTRNRALSAAARATWDTRFSPSVAARDYDAVLTLPEFDRA